MHRGCSMVSQMRFRSRLAIEKMDLTKNALSHTPPRAFSRPRPTQKKTSLLQPCGLNPQSHSETTIAMPEVMNQPELHGLDPRVLLPQGICRVRWIGKRVRCFKLNHRPSLVRIPHAKPSSNSVQRSCLSRDGPRGSVGSDLFRRCGSQGPCCGAGTSV